MPYAGGLSPSPERGGGGVPRLKRIVDSLVALRGTAYDASTSSSTIYQENLAIARCINAAAEAPQRLANQWDPTRMTDFLPRWEKMLNLSVSPTDTLVARRARVAGVFAQWGQSGLRSRVIDTMTGLLGVNFVALEYASPGDVTAWWPGGSTLFPAGTDGVQLAAPAWYSTYAHLRIQVTRLANQTEAQFQSIASSINPALDAILPAWVTWDWYTKPNGFSGSATSGFVLSGTNTDGYAPNLDSQVFDT